MWRVWFGLVSRGIGLGWFVFWGVSLVLVEWGLGVVVLVGGVGCGGWWWGALWSG